MGKKPRYVGTIEGLMKQIKTETDADKRDANKTSKTMNKDTKLYKPLESKYDELPEGLKKDTTTGIGANITVEGKSMGGEIEVGKGKDYISDLIK